MRGPTTFYTLGTNGGADVWGLPTVGQLLQHQPNMIETPINNVNIAQLNLFENCTRGVICLCKNDNSPINPREL